MWVGKEKSLPYNPALSRNLPDEGTEASYPGVHGVWVWWRRSVGCNDARKGIVGPRLQSADDCHWPGPDAVRTNPIRSRPRKGIWQTPRTPFHSLRKSTGRSEEKTAKRRDNLSHRTSVRNQQANNHASYQSAGIILCRITYLCWDRPDGEKIGVPLSAVRYSIT